MISGARTRTGNLGIMKPTGGEGVIGPNRLQTSELRDSAAMVSKRGAAESAAFPEDLKAVMRAWPTLPDSVKTALVAIAQSVYRTESH